MNHYLYYSAMDKDDVLVLCRVKARGEPRKSLYRGLLNDLLIDLEGRHPKTSAQ